MHSLDLAEALADTLQRDRNTSVSWHAASLAPGPSSAGAQRKDRCEPTFGLSITYSWNGRSRTVQLKLVQSPEERLEGETGSDDLERLVDVVSGEQQALELRKRAQRAGKEDLVELVDVYLSLGSEGRSATLREIGLALGISHTEVRLRLDELAALPAAE